MPTTEAPRLMICGPGLWQVPEMELEKQKQSKKKAMKKATPQSYVKKKSKNNVNEKAEKM